MGAVNSPVRERLVEAASELFYAQGLRAVSADRIIERVGTTKVTFRLSYQSPGGVLALLTDRVSSRLVRQDLKRSLERLKRDVEGGRIEMSKETPGITGRAMTMAGQGLREGL